MTYTERPGDLFTASPNSYLVHCISADFMMGAGIAKEFRNRGVKQYLESNYNMIWDGRGYTLFAPMTGFNGVFNLITKERYFLKPTYGSLKEALHDLKNQLPEGSNLAMPHIGCGLDKLSWLTVKEIICDIFADTNINITVYGGK